ncbi:MAG: ankyrin repeat domain-containing protein [Gemmatimonadetes bacterium]|nr:ankyrin repeat domain-containing protein [Gemmatimonadota bacterium]
MKNGLRASAVGAVAVLALLTGIDVAPDSPIADAAMRGDAQAVRSLLKGGADVNAAQGDGMTALHWAAENGDVEMANMLIYAGANLEAVTRMGEYTPLHVASEAGNAGIVKALLEAGADVHASTSVGSTPLHFAAMAGSAEAVVALLDHGADVNAREFAWGQTPLMFAAARNRVEAVNALLQRGADAAITSKVVDFSRRANQDRIAGAVRDSVLAAFRAASPDPVLWRPDPSQVQAAVRAAREHEAVEPQSIKRIDWDAAQTQGKVPSNNDRVGYQGGLTALLHAVREGNAEAARALLDAGADINQVSAGDLSSPLLLAMINGHFDLGLELLRRGANPGLANHIGNTPLYAVINTQWAPKARYPQQQAYQQQQATHLDVMEALLKAGADPNVRLTLHNWYMEYNFSQLDVDTWGATPFWRAAHALDIPAMKILVAYGADPHIPTKAPPGPVAYRRDDAATVDQSGLPPVPPGGPGVYPIHAATGFGGEGAGRAGNSHRHVRDGWLPAVKYLVGELGADVTLRDYLGYGTVHAAAARGNNDVILYLLSKGADPFVMGRSGMTTIDIANGPADGLAPFTETIKLLEAMGVKNNHRCVYC